MKSKVVYADVIGDLFHWGHVEFFRKCRALGSFLVVGVNSDETSTSYKREPIMTLEERVSVIEACRFVDMVVADAPAPVSREFIDRHGIDVVVHGDDMSAEHLKYWYRVPMEMGIFRSVSYELGISTSAIIDRIAVRLRNEVQ